MKVKIFNLIKDGNVLMQGSFLEIADFLNVPKNTVQRAVCRNAMLQKKYILKYIKTIEYDEANNQKFREPKLKEVPIESENYHLKNGQLVTLYYRNGNLIKTFFHKNIAV